MDNELLSIICCPTTHSNLRILTKGELTFLNQSIQAGSIKLINGSPVSLPFQDGLINKEGSHIYRIQDDIPVLLIEEAVAGEFLSKNL